MRPKNRLETYRAQDETEMKHTLTKFAAAAALAGLMAGCGANANQSAAPAGPEAAKPRAERVFARFDANGDGQITRDEMKAKAAERFAKMDANADGQVTRDERRAFRKARRAERQERRFARIDANADGAVTLDELKTHMSKRAERRFARLDADANGTLSLAELQAGKGHRGGKGRHGKRHEGRHGGRHGGRKGPITLQDLDARMMRMFDRADANADGVVTPDEAGKLGRRGRHGRGG